MCCKALLVVVGAAALTFGGAVGYHQVTGCCPIQSIFGGRSGCCPVEPTTVPPRTDLQSEFSCQGGDCTPEATCCED